MRLPRFFKKPPETKPRPKFKPEISDPFRPPASPDQRAKVQITVGADSVKIEIEPNKLELMVGGKPVKIS